MLKATGEKKPGKKDNKNTQSHIRARLDYLHQAAIYLQGKSTEQQSQKLSQASYGPHHTQPAQVQTDATLAEDKSAIKQVTPPGSQKKTEGPLASLSRTCVSHLREVAMKTQIRLPVTLKRSLCKRCATLLTPGVTCSHDIRNESRGGKKPWADVLIVRCFSCGAEKRFPQTERSSKKLGQRRKEKENASLPKDSIIPASGV